jgi:hypothetical protein
MVNFFDFFFLFLKLLRPFFKRFSKKQTTETTTEKKYTVGAMGISLSHVYRKLILGGVGANKGLR